MNDGMVIYLRDIGKIPLLTPQQEIDLAARVQQGDREARSLMVCANLRLVVKIAFEYVNLGLPLLDLVSNGNVGLMRAVERFDPARGKFSVYAALWIKQSIRRALSNQSRVVRLPTHLVDEIAEMRQASGRLTQELGHEPDDCELAEELGISSAKVSRLKDASLQPASIDAPISDDGDPTQTWSDIIWDRAAQTPFELLERQDLYDELRGLLVRLLTERERTIIFQRFGFDGERDTLETLGQRFSVTKERIRQLEEVALAKLHRALSVRHS
jgi:RNA polymerase primary sigma factor